MNKEKKKPAIPCTYESLEKELGKMIFILRNINYAVKRWRESYDKIIEVLSYGSREIERLPKRKDEIEDALLYNAEAEVHSACCHLDEALIALDFAKHSAQEAQEE